MDMSRTLEAHACARVTLGGRDERGEKEGMRPCMVCAFEIEGTFQLPDTGRPMFVRGLLEGSIHEIKPIAEHWRTMFNEVFNIAVDFLNAEYVRAQTHL